MFIKFLQRHQFCRKIIYRLGVWRSASLTKRIMPFLDKKGKILDIGVGPGNIYERLVKKGFKVTPLDIQDLTFVKNCQPILYDGQRMPFKDNAFKTSLLVTVLHHTSDPVKILQEAKRTSREMIIIEETYDNLLQKYLTFIMDSLTNLEFFNHSHSNKTDREWREIFKKLNLNLIKASYIKQWFFISSVTYYLKKKFSP